MLAHDLSKVSGHAPNWDFPFVFPLFLLVIYKGNTGLNLCPGTLERSCANITFSNHFGSFPAPPYRSLVHLYATKPSENKILYARSPKIYIRPPPRTGSQICIFIYVKFENLEIHPLEFALTCGGVRSEWVVDIPSHQSAIETMRFLIKV